MPCFDFIFTKGAIMGMGSWWHWAIVIAVVLILFGGKKIPELMKGIGTGIKGFKKALKDDDNENVDSADSIDNANSNAKSTKQITQSTAKKRGRPKGTTASATTSSTKKTTTKSSTSKSRATKSQ